MVEAIVAIPTFIVLFSSLLFAWQLYLKKIQVMGDARAKIWAFAFTDCTTGSPAGFPGVAEAGLLGIDPLPASNLSQATDPPASFTGNANVGGATSAASGGQMSRLTTSLGSATLTSQGSVQANGFLGSFASKVGATRTVQCNEPPYNGDLGYAVPIIYHDLTSW